MDVRRRTVIRFAPPDDRRRLRDAQPLRGHGSAQNRARGQAWRAIGESACRARQPARQGVERRVRRRHLARLGARSRRCPGTTRADGRQRSERDPIFDLPEGEGVGMAGRDPPRAGLRNPRASPAVSHASSRRRTRTQIHFSRVTVDPAVRDERRTRSEEEFQRMLYVTFTRAKRLLIVPDGSRLYNGQMPNFLGLTRWDRTRSAAAFRRAPARFAVDRRSVGEWLRCRTMPTPARRISRSTSAV